MFAYAHKPMRYTQWEKVFKPDKEKWWHFAVMRGDFSSNEAYCSKEGQLIEFGERPFQGQRRDLLSMKRKLDEGVPPMKLARDDEYFGVVAKHHRFAELYSEYLRGEVLKMNRDQPNVYLLKGTPGGGKTSWLDRTFGIGNYCRLPTPTGGNWWFTRECCLSDTIVIDDLGPTKVPEVEVLLEWIDRYPIQAPVKGGHSWVKPKNWVLTTNIDIALWWGDKLTPVHYQALMRRITEIVEI